MQLIPHHVIKLFYFSANNFNMGGCTNLLGDMNTFLDMKHSLKIVPHASKTRYWNLYLCMMILIQVWNDLWWIFIFKNMTKKIKICVGGRGSKRLIEWYEITRKLIYDIKFDEKFLIEGSLANFTKKAFYLSIHMTIF